MISDIIDTFRFIFLFLLSVFRSFNRGRMILMLLLLSRSNDTSKSFLVKHSQINISTLTIRWMLFSDGCKIRSVYCRMSAFTTFR